jgi:hypothetical protein
VDEMKDLTRGRKPVKYTVPPPVINIRQWEQQRAPYFFGDFPNADYANMIADQAFEDEMNGQDDGVQLNADGFPLFP